MHINSEYKRKLKILNVSMTYKVEKNSTLHF